MVKSLLKSELFFELVYNLIDSDEENEILKKIVPFYLRKLNCFFACVLQETKEGYEEKKMLPLAFRKNPEWLSIKSELINHPKKQDITTTFIHQDKNFYVFPLLGYGLFILARKNKFDEIFLNELKTIFILVGKTLNQSVERQRRIETEERLIHRQRILEAITLTTKMLLSNSNLDMVIPETLKIIGAAVRINQVHILEKKQVKLKEPFVESRYTWIDPEHKDNLPNQSFRTRLDHFADYESIITKGEPFHILPKKLEKDSGLKEMAEKLHILSLLVFPIYQKGKLWGFIAYQDYEKERLWEEYEILLLKNFASSITSSLEKELQDKKVRDLASFPLENPDPILRIDLNGKILLKNSAAQQIMPVLRSHIEFIITRINAKDPRASFSVRHKDQFFLAKARLSKRNDYINIYINNITKQKEAEETINQSNRQLVLFKNLINNSSDAVQVAQENGQLFYINQVASERLGISSEEVNQYKVQDFESIFEEEGSWEKHIEDLKRTDFITLEGENTNQTTGRVFPVEVNVKYILVDDVGFVMASSRDISERKRNEKILRLQEQKYRGIISNMNLGLMEVNNQEEILFCNQSFENMSGYHLAELEGKKASTLFLSKKNQAKMAEYNERRKKGISDSYEILVCNKQGDVRWWLISGAPRYDEQGKIIGSIGIHLDITLQKKLEGDLEVAFQKAQEASEAKEIFLANMSHEIRTPLNGIIGMIRELQKRDADPAQQILIKGAFKASRHLLSIVNNILDITKIEAGELELDKKHFDIQDLLNDVAAILNTQAQGKKIYFRTSVDEEIASAFIGDDVRLRQVLLNLAGNAIKFTEKGGVLISCQSVKKYSKSQKIILQVQDTGIGMNEDYQKKIFQKFQQEDAGIARQFGGTGLGMFITKELIDLMDGEITVSSEKNVGTTINIHLQFPLGDQDLVETKTNQEFDSKNIPPLKILLAEDNEMNRLVASQALAMLEVDLIEAENGQEAVDLLQKENFDLILMDLQMPIMDGMEATRVIRQELKNDIPIIALSANAFKSEIEACKKIGMNDYVTKPFEEKDLFRAIAKFAPIKKQSNENNIDNMPNPSDKLYDLSKLKQMSRGNEAFVQKMIHIFTDSIPKSIEEIQAAFEKNDWDTLRKVAHRIKPSIDNMGIIGTKDDIRILEKYSLENGSLEDLKDLVKRVSDNLLKVVEELEGN